MKYCTLKIEKPIVVHVGEIVDLEILKRELEICSSIKESSGLYVYDAGFNYPESTNRFCNTRTIHTYHNTEKTIFYIKQFIGMHHTKMAKVVRTTNGYRFEPV